MRVQLSKRCEGSTLLLTLFITGLLGFSLASYLTLVRAQNLSIMRSASWNAGIPMSEAGIEEAITHINRNGVTNLLVGGWTQTTNGYAVTRHFGRSYYTVTVTPSDPPVIISEGYVPVPLNLPATMGWIGWLATIGVDYSADQFTRRTVRVTTRRDSAWNHAMVAKGAIDLNGNNIATDSFDSTDPLLSTGGRYDPLKRRDRGHIATNLTITNSINVGNADIRGKASTGPGGTVAVGPTGAVGSSTWHDTNNKGIEPGWSADDMNVYLPDVVEPFSSGFTPQSGTLGPNTYKYLLNGGAAGADYVSGAISVSSSEVLFVTNKVRLLIRGDLDVKGEVRIAENSTFELYMAGETAFIGGNGVVNDTGVSYRFFYFGLPSNRSIVFAGNADFIGAIYAPSADFRFDGSGKTEYDFMGASVSNTVKMNGHFNFHYDEALGRLGWTRGFLITSWNEI